MKFSSSSAKNPCPLYVFFRFSDLDIHMKQSLLRSYSNCFSFCLCVGSCPNTMSISFSYLSRSSAVKVHSRLSADRLSMLICMTFIILFGYFVVCFFEGFWGHEI